MITTKLKMALLATVFILGCTNLAYELIILRQLVNFMGSNTILTSVVIAFILLFLSFGYYIGSVMSVAKFSIRKVCLRLMFVLTLWYIVSCSYYVIALFFTVAGKITMKMLPLIITFSTINLIAPAIMAGVVTALIGRIVHKANRNYTGRFMAVDTIGSVLGSLGTTLILMPFIGVTKTIFVMVIISAAAIVIISRKKQLFYTGFWFLFLATLSYCVNYENFFIKEDVLIKDDAVSRLEIVGIKNHPELNYKNTKIMFINAQAASAIAEDGESPFDYVKFITQNILQSLPKDKTSKILVLGAGGFTLGLNDEKNLYTYVDIEKHLQEISEEKFLNKKLTPNKKFVFADAYMYMLNDKEKYDVIILDIYSSVHSIPTNFVTAEFFNMIKNHLTDDGIMAANIITNAAFRNKFSQRLDNTFRYVFDKNLSRQIIKNFSPFDDGLSNIIYTYYNRQTDNVIFTSDKNSAMYGQY